MIDRAHDLPLNRQAKVLGISRGSVYYLPRAIPAADLALMRTIDALHLEYPFAGSRMLQGLLGADGQFTALLIGAGIRISMDGKGAWRDNVFVERIWKSVKYEEVYLRAYASVSDARASIGRYLAFYNGRRPHQSLGRQDARSGLLQCVAANPGCSITRAEIHLATAPKLFR
jgi:transposase InsO family protein